LEKIRDDIWCFEGESKLVEILPVDLLFEEIIVICALDISSSIEFVFVDLVHVSDDTEILVDFF